LVYSVLKSKIRLFSFNMGENPYMILS